MFTKALREHKEPLKPLASSQPRLNAASPAPMSQTTGEKRKFDAPPNSRDTLASLHNEEVYFHENDFDDDDDFDFSAPLLPPPPVEKPLKRPAAIPDKTATTPSPAENAVALPEGIPASSAPIPWSSSPSMHLQPPKRRTLPWLEKESSSAPTQANPTQRGNPFHTPVTKAPSYPWNKTLSAVKEEQKEFRKQQKFRTSNEKQGSKLHKPIPKVASIFLSDEQRNVLDMIVKKGQSVFFTGSAGTGKSVLMREAIRQLRDKFKNEPDRVAVTASTGLAACNISGVTLHSFAGVGLGKEDAANLLKKVKRNQKTRNRWLRTKVLIIDEISMVDGEFFDKLEELARKVRNNGRPFGGIQLVVTGDFFQLPPVPENGREAKFAFSANTWNTSIRHTILLTHVFRQKDPEFASMLNEMRLGRVSQKTVDAFRQLSRPLAFDDDLEATELFPTRHEVENANSARMSRLSGDLLAFTAVDSGAIQDVKIRDKLLSNCMAPPVIHLKKGAQVMLIKNMDDTLVNGSLGRISAFMDDSTYDHFVRNEESYHGDFSTEDDDLSRARKKIKSMATDPKNMGLTTSRLWPLVSFILPDGTERQLLCKPETWKVELPNGEVQAQRAQIPLILAWALSIHKAQGQTLQRVKVNLGKIFEKGQAYVALSRATSTAGLQITSFDSSKVMVHPKVKEFYGRLSTAQQIVASSTTTKVVTTTTSESYTKILNFEQDLADEFLGQTYN